jgi:hypothetical protein
MQDTVLYQRCGTTGGIKQIGTHNRSENGGGAWVALYANPLVLILILGMKFGICQLEVRTKFVRTVWSGQHSSCFVAGEIDTHLNPTCWFPNCSF